MSIGKVRTFLYKTARLLDDINAVRCGKIKQRIKRRIVGKIMGRQMRKIK
ncbi:hypothetical protein IQ10_01247 [Halalkalibacter nanhaiisediminis]|uniref:Uncharacterized protein n=1 Tax=Halalkalibacter nanhaiisediminis TaxID=688079 RepID=A0A562QMC8_9BACI|nr:hypothetical protein IQ10_01247 [Halalkalibacter nanhaiisediminis]